MCFIRTHLIFQDPALTITCQTDGTLKAEIDTTKIGYLDPTKTKLADGVCGVTSTANNKITITTQYNGCGTTSTQDGTYISYSNEITSHVKDVSPHITREYDLTFPFSCRYKRTDLLVHDNVHINPSKRVTILTRRKYLRSTSNEF